VKRRPRPAAKRHRSAVPLTALLRPSPLYCPRTALLRPAPLCCPRTALLPPHRCPAAAGAAPRTAAPRAAAAPLRAPRSGAGS